MRFETKLAWRHLVSGGGQTVLTVFAVAIAVTVIIFIQTLITGVQQRFVNDLVGPLPHITVKMPDPLPDTLSTVRTSAPGELLTTDVQKQVQKRTDVEPWKDLENQLAQFPGVKTVASAVRGSAFLARGSKRFALTVSGGEPVRQDRINPIQKDLIAGRWLDIGPDELVIGARLAEEAGIKLGDRVRLQSAQGVTQAFVVAGIFYSGNNAADLGQGFVTLRAAQSLFRTGQNVSSVLVKLNDPFQADIIAEQMEKTLPFKVDSWMKDSAFILNAIRSQNQSRNMICAFVLLASAFAIASVLIVSVIQKQKQIGILKSMGARDRQILTVFTLEGMGVAMAGALVGCVWGFLLLKSLENIPQAARFGKVDKLFNIIYDPVIFGGAALAAIVATLIAAILPARRASRLSPVEVIRG
jgi:lipoprotein-releasing system permease protein